MKFHLHGSILFKEINALIYKFFQVFKPGFIDDGYGISIYMASQMFILKYGRSCICLISIG